MSDDTANSRFFLPFSGPVTIRKSEDKAEAKNWVIYIEASNEFRDREKEIVLQEALKESADHFLKKGKISWNHLHRDEMGQRRPAFVIGHPLDVRFPEDRRSLVKGTLYRKNTVAQEMMANLESECDRFGASIGGQKLAKSFTGTVSKVLWDETAITYDPINDSLGSVQIDPMEEFVKSLMAGSGVNPGEFSGGRVMTREDLLGDRRNLSNDTKQDMMWGINSAMNGAIHEVMEETYKKAFKAAFQYIRENLDYDDEALKAHLKEKGFGPKTAEIVLGYIQSNMHKAIHILGIQNPMLEG